MGPNDSLGAQFNQQYEETVELVKSRALWRVGEQIEEGEAFQHRCQNCSYQSLHQRFDITRHRLLFGKSIRAIEAPRPMLRCRRCGHQQHLRDVGELVVPSTVALAAEVRRLAAAPDERATTTSSEPSDELLAAITALNEETSGPVRRAVFNDVVQTIGHEHDALLRTIGSALFLGGDQIATALGSTD